MLSLTYCAVLLAAAPATGSETVLLDFTSASCGPCQQMRPVIQRLAAAGYAVREVTIEKEPGLAGQYGVTQVPTFVLVANGREVGRQVGATAYENLVQMLSAAGAKGSGIGGQGSGVGGNTLPAIQPPLSPISATSPLAPHPSPLAANVVTAATQASVRVRVRDGKGTSNGSGTIVDLHGDEALVLTCGHIFRDSDGKGPITVDVFGPQPVEGRPGELVAYDLKRDVGLVSFRPGVRVVAAPVAAAGATVRAGDRVVSVGCDHGAPPTARLTQVNAVNKFLGPANVVIDGEPIQGRSGGGLFNARGEVIGVCNAADPTDREGLFAALATIHAQLDDANLAFIYRGSVAKTAGREQKVESRESPAENRSLAAAMTAGQTALPPGAEVVCIVRTLDDPRAKSDVYVLDRVSPDFLRVLNQERTRQQARVPTSSRDDLQWRRAAK